MAAIEEQIPPPNPQPRGTRPRRKSARAARGRGRKDLVWNVLTVFVWLGMACVAMAFAAIYANPMSLPEPLRPFPPTLVSEVHLPTSTATPPPSSTPVPKQPTRTFTPTSTPVTPTVTFTPSPTVTETPTPGPSPTPTIYSAYPFILRGEIKVIPGATFPDHDTCKLWVAGQAYDLQGAPMQGITMMLGGALDGKTLYQLSLTGTALQYGQAGFEFTVADKPVNSKQSAWVALFDQAMLPLSGKIYFDTYDDCSKNLILVNFRQVR